jgi:benzylsuccinate CoA-transferase BbsF subunit
MERPGNRDAGAAPHDVYRCRGDDAWCAIAVTTDEQWRALCSVIGRVELASDARYATLEARKAHEGELRSIIEAWSTDREAGEAMLALQGAGVPCATLNNADRLLNQDPQLRERGLWSETEHPELGTTIVEGWGFTLSQAQPARKRAPMLGEHTDYVLQQLIGMSEDEVNLHLVSDVLR